MGKLRCIEQYLSLIYRDNGRWQLGGRSGGLYNGAPATDSAPATPRDPNISTVWTQKNPRLSRKSKW